MQTIPMNEFRAAINRRGQNDLGESVEINKSMLHSTFGLLLISLTFVDDQSAQYQDRCMPGEDRVTTNNLFASNRQSHAVDNR